MPVRKSYLDRIKAVEAEFAKYLLLSGLSPMTGKFQGLDAIFRLPNTSLEVKELDLTPTWGMKFALLKFTDNIATSYGAMSGALFLLDLDGFDKSYLIFASGDGTNFGYLEYTPSTDILEFKDLAKVKFGITEIGELKITQWIDSLLKPKVHDAYDLGYTHAIAFLKRYWRNLYLSGTAYANTIRQASAGFGVTIENILNLNGVLYPQGITVGNVGITTSGHILAMVSGWSDLGMIAQEFGDVFFVGTMSAGDIVGLAGKTVDMPNYKVGGVAGVNGTFTTVDGKTVTVTKGLITSIV